MTTPLPDATKDQIAEMSMENIKSMLTDEEEEQDFLAILEQHIRKDIKNNPEKYGIDAGSDEE